MSTVELPASRTGRHRARLRALLLLALSVFMTAAVAFALPAQQAYALGENIGVGVLSGAAAEAGGAAAVAGAVAGETAVGAGAVAVAPALIAIGLVTAGIYLASSYADGTGPFAPGGLIDWITSSNKRGNKSSGSYWVDYVYASTGVLGPESVHYARDCQGGRDGNFCGSFGDGMPGNQTVANCMEGPQSGNYGHTYTILVPGQTDVDIVPCQQNPGDYLISGGGSPGDGYGTSLGNDWINPTHFDLAMKTSSIVADKTCRPDGATDGSNDVKVSKTLPGFTNIPSVACPAGTFPVVLTLSTIYPNGNRLGIGDITQDPTVYPLCIHGCQHIVKVDGKACSVGIALCWDWMNVKAPDSATCDFGPYSVGLAECGALAYAFQCQGCDLVQDPGTLPGTQLVPAGPDHKPDRRYGPGTSAPAPSTTPVPAPTATPTATPTPTASASPSATPTPTATPTSPPAPGQSGAPGPGSTTDESACFPSGWGVLNPVEWVLKPVKCALVWAFVPSPGVFTDAVSSTRDVLASRPPVSLIPVVAAPFSAFVHSSVGGCGAALADFGGGLVIPCSPGGAGWAVTLYGIASVSIGVGTGLSCWRMLDTALSKQGTS